jgi:hypothetical protein
MIGPAGFGQAPSEPAECAEWEPRTVPALPTEPGHVMSLKDYERLFGKQK